MVKANEASFRRDEYDVSTLEIYSLNADGTAARRITTLKARSSTPAFIADDNWIMFSSNYAAKQFHDAHLFVMSFNGTYLTQV